MAWREKALKFGQNLIVGLKNTTVCSEELRVKTAPVSITTAITLSLVPLVNCGEIEICPLLSFVLTVISEVMKVSAVFSLSTFSWSQMC